MVILDESLIPWDKARFASPCYSIKKCLKVKFSNCKKGLGKNVTKCDESSETPQLMYCLPHIQQFIETLTHSKSKPQRH